MKSKQKNKMKMKPHLVKGNGSKKYNGKTHQGEKEKKKKKAKNHCLKDFLKKSLKLVVEKEDVKKSSSTPTQKKKKKGQPI